MPSYRLSYAAEKDIALLFARTRDRFGKIGLRRYQALLITGLREIALDPDRRGSVARPELGEGVRTYHLRHSRDRAGTAEGIVRHPRHLLLYRAIDPGLIGIGRVLHDAMELARHLPDRFGDE